MTRTACASCARATRPSRPGHGPRLQHRPARGARGGLPARLRRGDRGRRAGPHREPRRPLPRGLPGAQRHRTGSSTRSRIGARAAPRHQATSRSRSPSSSQSRGPTRGRPLQVDLRILRFDPERDDAPHWEEYDVESEPMDRVLDLLHRIKWEPDGTLTFRRSCAHGVCGSDAMMINGRNRLACKIRVDQLGTAITVAPLPGMPGRQGPRRRHGATSSPSTAASCRTWSPTTIRRADAERLQSQADRDRYDDTTKCILCAACTTLVPVVLGQADYVGPAAIVNAHRFIFDSRDDARRGAAGDPGRRGRRVALPDDLQLRRCLPARHQHHPARSSRSAARPWRPPADRRASSSGPTERHAATPVRPRAAR